MTPRSEPGHERQVHRFRQPLLGAPLRLGDGLEPRVAHHAPLRRGRRPEVGERIFVARSIRRWHGRASDRPSDAGRGSAPRAREQRLAVSERALGIGPVERQSREELGRHAATAARVVGPHEAHAPPDCGSRSSWNNSDSRHTARSRRLADVAGEELVVDREGAGVDVADGVDEADDATRAAQVQARQRLAVGGQVEEGVAGEHVFAVGEQPVVELALLVGGRVQLVPDVGAATRGSQPGEPQLSAVADRRWP